MKAISKYLYSRLRLLSIIGIVAALSFGCKRSGEINGPQYITAPEGFEVVGNSFMASKASVDFSGGTDSISFHASFSHEVSWIVTLTGQTSGAEMVIEGLSSSIDGSNCVWWTGGHTGTFFFEDGETVTATLSFLGSSLNISDSFVLTAGRDWSTKANLILPNNNGFELNFTGWFEYNAPLNEIVTVPSAVEGTNCVYIFGNGAPDFVTGIGTPPGTFAGVPADPDSVYVNLYVYGTGNPNAFVSYQFKEADKDEADLNYGDATDDAWEARITLDFTGWKLFSFKYSQLTASEAADFGGSGNKVHEPDRIKVIQVGLQTTLSQYAEVYFDYPTITINGPFDPSI